MNIIVPMAGWGSRLRPHTLTIPKPLVPIAGKPIVQRLVEDLMDITTEKVDNVVFIIREEFGKAIEDKLMSIADGLGVNGVITYQDEPLGTAHAILCAGDYLEDEIIIAFADTLFRTENTFDTSQDGVIIVKQIEDPRAFGVVKLNEEGSITEFVEKPQEFVSDLAIIGIYFIKDGKFLRQEMQHLIDNDIRDKGEYQLTNALESMKQKGRNIKTSTVEEWLDCGNKDACIYTNQRVLEFKKNSATVASDLQQENSIIIPPCYIAEGVSIRNSVVGPHVSIGKGTVIEDCVVKNSIIQDDSEIKWRGLKDSMIGSKVQLIGKLDDLSLGDYTVQR